jgi:hypothetical protein
MKPHIVNQARVLILSRPKAQNLAANSLCPEKASISANNKILLGFLAQFRQIL